MAGAHDDFAGEYLRELEALRREGREFANDHPKVANRLRLEDNQSQDPHVERLLEGFAFLTARVQRKLDDDHAELSASLLGVLHPHLVQPVPSMALAEVELDVEQSVPAAGKRIPRGTTFLTPPVRGEPLRFRSTADVVLHPIRMLEARVEMPDARCLERFPRSRSVLRWRLGCAGEHPFGVMAIDALRVQLKGDQRLVHALYEMLTTSVAGVELRSGGEVVARLPASSVQPAGLDSDEASLPYPRRSFAGYRLLQEYFAFPEKFHVFRVAGLDVLKGRKLRELELRLVLTREFEIETADIEAGNFGLGCVPLVNLFAATADPILVTSYQGEYDVVPDSMRPAEMEVHTVEGVTGVSNRTGERLEYRPFYSLRHDGTADGPQAFWHMRRRRSMRVGDLGTEVSLALVQLDMTRADVADQTLHVDLLCTNRDMPSTMASWGSPRDFSIEGVTGIKSVRCLNRPTKSQRIDLHGSAQWRLVSALALNQLSLVAEGRDNLRELLRLHDFADSQASRRQIEGIADVRSEIVVRRLRAHTGGGFGRGTLTTLVLDRAEFVGGCPMLFAAVLERFLAQYCAVNAFSQLALETTQDQGVVHTWSPRTGEQSIL
ncbi:MAG: type VI secretion system baseplate subunit TssF [Planctomycetes bacterium]|nr:type VI secretion system baseplate subunit TssF [Planctomycetota bacterium]